MSELPNATVTVTNPDGTTEIITSMKRGRKDPNFKGWDEVRNADGSITCTPRA